MITVRNLSKYYHDGSGHVAAVKNLDMNIGTGAFVSIVGRSGSGKSTLLKMLGGLLRPDEGEVRIDNVDIYAMSEREMADYWEYCGRCGSMCQECVSGIESESL